MFPLKGKIVNQFKKQQEALNNVELSQDAATSQVTGATDKMSLNGQQLQLQILNQLERVNKRAGPG